jgi:phosphohistidine phosphatase
MVRTLFLLRHAKSSWDEPLLGDHERPLTKRGRRATKVIARYLRSQGVTPELVLCSSARRTQETLERLTVGCTNDVEVHVERDLYLASAVDLLDRVRLVPAEVSSVLLIGHNPAIQELALTLARRAAEVDPIRQKFPTAALATLSFDAPWEQLSPGGAELTAFVKPRDLERS